MLRIRSGAFIAALLLLCAACTARAPRFSLENAQAHVRQLAGTIGSRPTGTDANRRAREYIIGQLHSYGFSVRVQETDAARVQLGATVRVANIIATRPGPRRQVIALVSHYDSVPDGPGAADDGAGVAVCLEAGRVLAQRERPNHPLALIFTDGEELGLMGAAAVMKDPIMASAGAVLNFEAIGSGPPGLLFETGPGSGGLLEAWARSAPAPAGASYIVEVYKRLPNDTDFTLFKRAGIRGLNFAPIGDGYSYHTARDTPERLDPAVVRQIGENTVATVEAIDDAADLSTPDRADTIYFDVLRTKALAYRSRTALVLLAAGALLGLFGWLTILPVARAEAGIGRLLLTGVWTLVGLAAVFGAMVGATWLLRATREMYQPWYAHPDRFFIYLALAGMAGGWAIVQLGRLLPRGARGSAHPAVAWTITLPCWLALAVAAQLRAPSASYLAVIPLIAAGATLVVSPVRRVAAIRIASAIILAVAGILWINDAIALVRFAVPVLGRLPIVTPLFAYPALLLCFGLFIVPPLLAIVGDAGPRSVSATGSPGPKAGRYASTRAGLPLALALVLACAWCWFAPAYTGERPLYGSIWYVNDLDNGRARWQIASNEPGIHVGVNGPIAGGWQAGTPPGSFGVPIRLSPGPFAYYGASSTAEPPPVTATGSLRREQDGASIEINVVPRRPGLAVVFSLPPGVVPEQTSLVGRQASGGPFTARYAALPPEGVTFHADIGRSDADRLESGAGEPRATVLAIAPGLPGAAWPTLPSWLPRERVVWQARSYFAIPVPLTGGRSGQ